LSYKLLIILKITIMNSEEKNVMNDETRLDGEANPSETTENAPVNSADSDKKDASKSWAKNAASGAAGAAAGIGGAFLFSSFKEAEEPVTDPQPQPQPYPSPNVSDFDGNQVSVAEGTNNGMSFSQAFAAARNEVGPGGVFFWRGGVYGTYYKNEWENFSPEYKRTFSNYPYQPQSETNEEYDASGNHHAAANTHGYHGNNVNHDDVIIPTPASDDNVILVSDEIPEVEVLHAEIDGQSISYVPTYIDGQETVFIDVDNDGVYDAIIINDYTDNPPVYDLHEEGIHIRNEEIQEIQDSPIPHGSDDIIDYTNDASVDSFA
jgi:hypothetical protein